MRISTVGYTFRQGIKNILRNKVFSLATIATISACVFLFGLFFAVVVNFQNIVKKAQSGVAVTVFFDEGIDDTRIQEIGQEIGKRAEVSRIVFVSAEEAWNSFKDDYLGEYVDTFGDDNPLSDCANYEIYMNDVSMQDSLVGYLQTVPGIREVHKSANVANALSSVNSLVAYVSLGIIAILFAVSIFLISNTVAIGITVRREEIAIMKLIGATDFVVRAPFVFEGIILGIIGAGIPLAALYYIYDNLVSYVTAKYAVLSSILVFMSVDDIFYYLAPIAVIMGVGIGFLGSSFTVRRHLRV
ncbi:MAG: permease-like cell division protein FtsX [Lachnospiraceae bacterium]|nr:permease-like cell division protein FtsX [Lachnospiraceae bacterium]